MRPFHAPSRRPTRRRYFLRRAAVVVGALVVLAAIGFGVDDAAHGLGGGPGGRQGSPPSASTTVPETTTTTLPPPPEPGGRRHLFPGKRIVAFYGAPGGSGLGILGAASPEATWAALEAQAAPYAQAGTTVLPAYELIAFVAQAAPGPDGTYSTRLPDAEIAEYLKVVQAHDGMLILDIQPGRGSFLTDAESLAPYLSLPDVGLALDPEWQVAAPYLPGQIIGQTTATEINTVGLWLDRLTIAHRLPQKLFLIHQFTLTEIENKPGVQPWRKLATVFNMDGFGAWPNKKSVYHALAADPRFPLGFKLFYHQDTPLYPPSAVLGLQPEPDVIEYE